MKKHNIQATNVTLKNMEHKHKLAKRGYELLKEKQDGLIHEFMIEIRKTTLLRKQFNLKFEILKRKYNQASLWYSQQELNNIINQVNQNPKIHKYSIHRLGLLVPQFEYHDDSNNKIKSNNELLRDVLHHSEGFLEMLVTLSNQEKLCLILADEIKGIRRRVNALEHKTIPELENTIKWIKLKLDDQARNEQARVMKLFNQ